MKYCIIDIETTGGKPGKDKITEIAIIKIENNIIIDQFESLVNPECFIPYFITKLTGITNEMVVNAPKFHEIGKQIVDFTEGYVFVAHNVNFDYSFVKASFKDFGYNYNRKTLCSVRLSRKSFPGLPSYSLGKLCDSLEIELKDRHRAFGDAHATALLFLKILENNTLDQTDNIIDNEISGLKIPPLLDEKIYHDLPDNLVGVYYFHDQNGNLLYVGKSINIKKRISQHFSVISKNKKSIELKNKIADISFEETGSEIVALLFESDEIKRLKPYYNTAQKRIKSVPFYGLFSFEDEKGYLNVKIDRIIKEDTSAIITFNNMFDAKNKLQSLVEKYNLCLSKCDSHKTGGPCFYHQIKKCNGACLEIESVLDYNQKVISMIDRHGFVNESFLLIDSGRHKTEKSIILIEKGVYKGFGFLDSQYLDFDQENMLSCIKKYSHNKDIQKILCGFSSKNLKKLILQA